jgi:hypothetical protein
MLSDREKSSNTHQYNSRSNHLVKPAATRLWTTSSIICCMLEVATDVAAAGIS